MTDMDGPGAAPTVAWVSHMSIGGLDMRRGIALLAVPVLTGAAPAARAADRPPAADLRMAYDQPELAADGAGITWHWTMTNAGTVPAETVIATHRVSAGQQVVQVSAPCTAHAVDVVCQFDTMRPGEKRLGWIRTMAGTGGELRVHAQVTWRETPSVLPGVGETQDMDTGDSWGLTDTEAGAGSPR
jgi:hypothetical protein